MGERESLLEYGRQGVPGHPDPNLNTVCCCVACRGGVSPEVPFAPDWLCVCGHRKDFHPQRESGAGGRCEECECRSFHSRAETIDD